MIPQDHIDRIARERIDLIKTLSAENESLRADLQAANERANAYRSALEIANDSLKEYCSSPLCGMGEKCEGQCNVEDARIAVRLALRGGV